MKILVVDDSSTMRRILKGGLVSLGYSEVLEASNGLEGQSILAKNNDIKLAFVDWNMPNMNGYDFLKFIKKSDSFKEIPVIMVATEAEKENIIKAIKAGASNYLIKPFIKEILIDKIKAVFV